MRIVVFIALILIYRSDGHGQHGTGNQPATDGQQPHVTRKMEDYVHDME
jgi:hypothetical protein